MAKEQISGEIDWNAADLGGSKQKTSFLKLVQGENKIRILANPYQSHVHWCTLQDGSSRKVNSPTANPALVKRLEDAGFRRQPSWILKVLDRSNDDESKQEFKLLEVSKQIYDGVLAYVNNKKYGKCPLYDIVIIRGPKGQNPLYRVIADPPEPLDNALKAKFAEFNETIDLEKLTSPMPSEEIEKLLGWGSTESGSKSKTAGEKPKFDYDFE